MSRCQRDPADGTIDLLKRNYQAVLSVLDQLHVGLCIVSENGLVLVCNAEAERIFKGFSGIRLTQDQRLRCANADSQRLLDRALQKACRQQLNQSDARTRTIGKAQEILLMPDPEQTAMSPLIEVMPLNESKEDSENHPASAVVTLTDTSNPREISVDRVAVAFGLTSAETEICRMLVDGRTTREMANERRVSIETIKTQIKSVLRKSHCKRRSELIRLVTVMHCPIGGN